MASFLHIMCILTHRDAVISWFTLCWSILCIMLAAVFENANLWGTIWFVEFIPPDLISKLVYAWVLEANLEFIKLKEVFLALLFNFL